MRHRAWILYSFLLAMIMFSYGFSWNKPTNPKYDWVATVSAPLEFPISLFGATLKLADGHTLPVMPKALEANGWGELGAVALIGDDLKTAPVELKVEWFSFVERKSYGGTFPMDKTRFMEVFKQGFIAPATDTHHTYTHLVIGMAPQGTVVVWLSGWGVTTEIAQFKAVEIHPDMKETVGTYNSFEEFAVDVIDKSLPKGRVRMSNVRVSDLEKWSGPFRKMYDWHLTVSTTRNTDGVLANYFNGEALYWPSLAELAMKTSSPLPRIVSIRWHTKSGNPGATDISFDEQEIFAAFERLGETGLDLRMTLNQSDVTAVLVGKTSSIPLLKTKVIPN